MRKAALAVIVLGLAACGGDDDTDAPAAAPADDEAATTDASNDGDDRDGASGGGQIVDRQPPGQAFVAVDGQEFTLTGAGGVNCAISDEAIAFGFGIDDNAVTLGGGANLYDEGWLGDIRLTVYDVAGQEGPNAYSPDLAANGERLVIDGNSMSYSGPMQKQPPNDGTNPPPVDIGNGTISVTC